jgi:hypothetical protein
VATASFDPIFSVVLSMVHHPQEVNYARLVVHATYKPEAVVAHVKDDAIPNLIGRPERLLDRAEVRPDG